MNLLLKHERQQQSRYRNAVDDLAHSLKTPLAVLRGIADTQGLDKEMRARLGEHVDRMDEIVSYQLRKAVTAGKQSLRKPIALLPVVEKNLCGLEQGLWGARYAV